MPANLPPQYYELEREFRAEKDLREKLRLAQELLVMMPKHKGTDKLQADMKGKISKLRKQIEGGGAPSHGARQAPTHDHIEKEGAGQIILIGPPNSGKSSLVDALTHAKPIVADYPYSTREPIAGMMPFETIQFQLIDTPPISPDSFEGYLTSLIRNADLAVLVCDLEADTMLTDLLFIREKLKERHIMLTCEKKEMDDPRLCAKKTILCAHKAFEDEDCNKRKELSKEFPNFPTVATSIIDDKSLDGFKKMIYTEMAIMRVYTKPVGKDVEYDDPIILPIGGTVVEAATSLHRDFAAKLKFAKIWGEGKFDGQRVQLDFELSDGDIIEFHI